MATFEFKPNARSFQRILCWAWALTFLAVSPTIFASSGESLRIEIEVIPAAKRYTELAAYPAYLAVALQNSGFSPIQSGRLIIEDAGTLRFGSAALKFIRQEKSVYYYQASIEWSIGIAQSKFEIPVAADLSHLNDGKVEIAVTLPLAKFFPSGLTDKIKLKLQSMANPVVQQRLVAYLDGLPGSAAGQLDLPKMFERILIDAYNLPPVTGASTVREPGDAEPLSDQILLIVTLLIWVAIVPLGFAARRFWRRHRATK